MSSSLSNPFSSRIVLSGAYSFESLEDLPAVRANIAKLSELLTSKDYWGVPDGNCISVIQPEGPADILDAVYDAAQECTGTLVFYYSGHGLTSPLNDELSLAVPHTNPDRPHTSVRFDDVRSALLSARGALRKIAILDCCFSGRAMKGNMASSEELAGRSAIDGTYLLTASAENKTALAPPGEEFTAFTGELIRIIEHGVPGPELLDLDTIYMHLLDRLTSKGRPVPQQRNRNGGSRIALVKNARYLKSTTSTVDPDLLNYMAEAARRSFDGHAARTSMRAIYLPYSERIRNASALAHYDEGSRQECLEALDEISMAPYISGMDVVEVLKAIVKIEPTRKGECVRALEGIATGDNWTPIVRGEACKALRKFGHSGAAARGYRRIMDGERVLPIFIASVAREFAEQFPEFKQEAVERLWRIARNVSEDPKQRIEALRSLAKISPDLSSEASELVRSILERIPEKPS
ncbi:caspase domain-containing protein [Streptomyces sioyaensis]|uniref:caspase domain-containing protein n=1 Tax=Streptomyces sioyaensis TaxID=67364 RepID=UPI00379A0E2B